MAALAEIASSGAAQQPSSQSQSFDAALAANTQHFRRPTSDPRDQFDRYMADVKKTALMSPETLTQVARDSYASRYGMLKAMSNFPPCAEAVVKQFQHYQSRGFKLNGFLDSYGDQSVAAKDVLARLNESHGQGKVEDALIEEETRRRGLETLSGHWCAFRDADPAIRSSTNSTVHRRLSHTFLYLGFRYDEFLRLCKIFEDVTCEIQRFADLFVSLATNSEHLHILDQCSEADIHAIMLKVPTENKQRFYREATSLLNRLRNIGLSMRQCIELRADYDFHKSEMKRLNNRIVESNLLLAAREALRQRPADDRLFDACQEANEGLISAVNRFAYWKGYRFATYACTWIKQRVQRNHQHTINSDFPVPISIVNRRTKIHRVREAHGEYAGERPLTAKQIADKVGCTREQVDEASVAFNAVTNSEEVTASISSELRPATVLAEQLEMAEVIQEALGRLPDIKAEVCKLRWGLEGTGPLSLREIGTVLNLSTERVRNIETEALRKLANCQLAGRMRELLVGA